LHVEYAIEPDGSIGLQPVDQQIASPVPELAPDALPAKIRSDDEKPHEAEVASVRHDRSRRDDFAFPFGAHESIGIGRPERISVTQAGVHPSAAAHSTAMSRSSRVA
jgi:hypothetical protein